jgi:hypothetical protein
MAPPGARKPVRTGKSSPAHRSHDLGRGLRRVAQDRAGLGEGALGSTLGLDAADSASYLRFVHRF